MGFSPVKSLKTDYVDAFSRHREDGNLLCRHARWPNADQLYGLSAECGLKALMVAMGMQVRDDGSVEGHRVHINKLWDQFLAFAEGRSGTTFSAWLPKENPFADWSVAQRYARSETITTAAVQRHKRGLDHVAAVVAQARADGSLL